MKIRPAGWVGLVWLLSSSRRAHLAGGFDSPPAPGCPGVPSSSTGRKREEARERRDVAVLARRGSSPRVSSRFRLGGPGEWSGLDETSSSAGRWNDSTELVVESPAISISLDVVLCDPEASSVLAFECFALLLLTVR